MAMKYLSQFMKFDFDSFMAGKVLRVVGVSELVDYDSKKHLGTKIETVITQDDTNYRHKDGESGSNRFEKLTLKVLKDVNPAIDDAIQAVNAKATVYGEYRNQLSVKCDDIRVLQPIKPKIVS